MRFAKQLETLKPTAILLMAHAIMFALPSPSTAQQLNAGAVLNKMNSDQRHGYLSGIVEGLAYARWLRDKPDGGGMKCIYRWYYEGGTINAKKLNSWLHRHPDKPVSALMHVLIKKDCGA